MVSAHTKPLASLSLDLDNQWSYMKTHGDAGWESFPSYLDIVVPRVLKFLEAHELKITFFIVGQDAALPNNYAAIRSIANAGHEIGNHSFSHEPWLHLYSEQQITTELARAEKEIERVTGQRTIGFRGPGYSLSKSVLRILFQRGYKYDASTLPTFLGPLARAYYFMTTKLAPEEKRDRKLLFGTFGEGFRPIKPYRWKLDKHNNGILEIPVTTMPLFRIPFHASYVMYISRFSRILALYYFRMAVRLCRLTHTFPSLLLHPLDFLGCEDMNELSFFPAMDLLSEKKIELVSELVKIYANSFTIVPLGQAAHTLSQKQGLLVMDPVLWL